MAYNPRKGFHTNNWNNTPSQNHQGNWNNNYQQDEMLAPPPPSLSQPDPKPMISPNYGGQPYYQAPYSEGSNPAIRGNLQPAYSGYTNPSVSYRPGYPGNPNEPPKQPHVNVNNWNVIQNQQATIPQPVPPVTLPVPTFANKVGEHKQKKVGIESEVQRQKAALTLQRTEYIKKAKCLKDNLDLLKEQHQDLRGNSKRSPSPETKSYLQNNNKLQMEIKKELKTIFNVVKMLNGIIEEKKPVDDKDDDDEDSEERKSRSEKNKSKRRRSPERRRSSDNRSPERRRTPERRRSPDNRSPDDLSSAWKKERSSDRQGKSKSKKEDRNKRDSPERSSKREKNYLLMELQKKLKESQRRESRMREERISYMENREERSSEMENILLAVSGILSSKAERSRREDGSYRLDKRAESSSDDNDEYQSQGNNVPSTDIHRPSKSAGTDNFSWLYNIANDPMPNRKRHTNDIEQSAGPKKARHDIPTEVSPSTQQIETNSSDILDKIMSLIQNEKGNYKMAPENILPEFDPMACNQTMLAWVMKVDRAALIYNWTDKEILKYAFSKLTGVAKTWLDTLPTVIYTWAEWKQKLIESFSNDDSYPQCLTEMLNKRSSCNESLEAYYYEKLALLNKCKIFKKYAVDCIIHGIDDKVIKGSARAAGFNEPENLLRYLQTIKITKTENVPRKQPRCNNCNKVGHVKNQCEILDPVVAANKIQPNVASKKVETYLFNVPASSTSTTPPNILLKCANCNETGHYNTKCPKPKVLCTLCGKKGHCRDNCFRDQNMKRIEKRTEMVCFNCGEKGHPSFKCSKLRNTCLFCGKLGHIQEYCTKNKKAKKLCPDVSTSNTSNEFQNKNVIIDPKKYNKVNLKQATNECNNREQVVEIQSTANIVHKIEMKHDTSINEDESDIAELNVSNESSVKEDILTMKLDEPNVVTNNEAAKNEENQNKDVIQNSNVTESVTGRNEQQTEEASTALDSTNNQEISTDNVETPADNVENSADNVEMSADNVEMSADNVEKSADNVEMSADNVEKSVDNVETSTNNEEN